MTRAEPVLADDVIVSTPLTCDIASSMGLMSPVSTSSGDAPGQEMLTETVGLSTSGNWLMPIRETARIPKRIVPNIIIHARTGRRRQTSVMFTDRLMACPRRGGRSRARARRTSGPLPRRTAADPEAAAAADWAAASVVRSLILTGAPSVSASKPCTTSSSPTVRPLVTSTPPSGVYIPSATGFTCATFFSSTV